MNRSRWIALAATLAVVALVIVWWRARHAPDAPKYRTAAVERGPIEEVVSATGTVRPVVQVQVGSQVSGTVAQLFADYNSRVRQGQVLLQLEPSSFRARLLQSEAAVARAQAALADAQRQYRRAKELLPENYVSQADVDGAEATAQQRQADLKQAQAQLDAARVDLANTTIRAPIDGVVISRAVDRGQTVAASLSAPELFVIANDLERMQVETRIDESDIGVIHTGLPATFTVDAFPDITFRGTVAQVRLEPIIDQNVVTYTTVIETRNPAGRLRPGMTANVSVLVAQRDDAIKVPNAALRFRPPNQGRRGGGARESLAGGSVAQASPGTAGAGAGMRDAAGAGGRGGAVDHPGATASDPAKGGAAGGTQDPTALRRELFAKVRSGELTREQAIEQLTAAGGGRGGGAGWAGGSGGWRRGAGAAGAPDTSATGPDPGRPKPGVVWVLRGGKPTPIRLLTGITDGAFTEVHSDDLKPGDQVLVGLDVSSEGSLAPPPGMGGPMFGRGGGGGRR